MKKARKSYLLSITTALMTDLIRRTWGIALSPPPKTRPQNAGPPPFPAGGGFIAAGSNVWRGKSQLIYYGIDRGRSLLHVLARWRRKGTGAFLERITPITPFRIQNGRGRRHWSRHHLDLIDRSEAEDYRDQFGNVSSSRDQLSRLHFVIHLE